MNYPTRFLLHSYTSIRVNIAWHNWYIYCLLISVFLLKYTFCHFYTGWYITKYKLYMYYNIKPLFYFFFLSFKLHLLWYLICNDHLIIHRKNNKLYLNLKGIILKRHLIRNGSVPCDQGVGEGVREADLRAR